MKKINFKKIDEKKIIRKNFMDSLNNIKNYLEDDDNVNNLINICKLIKNKLKKGGKIYFAGNGGSASDSLHLSAELISKLSKKRIALPADNLVSNISAITAISNDYNYKNIFSRQIEANLSKNDIFFAITTSGNSKNIISGLNTCKRNKLTSILLTGYDGGKASKLSDFCIKVPSKKTQTIQELHILIGHCICEIIEESTI